MAISIDLQSPDITAINLARALDRLERKILSTPPDTRLLRSSYERTKTSANLEYARTLLLRLEHTSSTIKIQSRKQRAQTALLAQRALLKRLTDRLHEFDQLDDNAYSSDSAGEDLLGEDEAPAVSPKKEAAFAQLGQEAESTLRNRFPQPPASSSTAALFSPSTPISTANGNPAAVLESEEATQAELTSDLASMASLLKQRVQEFSVAIEVDKEVTDKAAEGLEKNAQGMDAAGRKMGTLRRMSEGTGWWGRMMLYAWIGGLWAVAIMLVFVGPKFRF